jgi:hypothetical protein
MSYLDQGPVTRVEVVNAMLQARGDYKIASTLIGTERISESELRVYVGQDEKLRALYLPPKAEDIRKMVPEADPLVVEDDDREKFLDRNTALGLTRTNLELTLESMRKAGVKQSVLDKVETLNSVQLSGAAFLATTLNSTQKLLHYGVLKLVEQMEFIDSKINDPATPDKAKVAWMYLYANLSEQVCKYHDRILGSTEALVRMSNRDKAKKKEKPGFSER